MDWKRIKLIVTENLVWVLILIFIAIFAVLAPAFFSFINLRNILKDASTLGYVALGLGICVLAGDFDVSLGQIVGFSAVFTAWVATGFDISWVLVALIPIGLGLAIGVIYGLLVGKGGQNPFLITIGGYIIWQALARLFGAARYLRVTEPALLYLGKAKIMGISASVIAFIPFLLLAWIFVNYTRKGHAIYAVGRSVKTAERLGINTNNTKLLVHALGGMLAGFGGLVWIGIVGGEVQATIASGQIFRAFGAVAIAGLSIFGGRGNLLHILGGVIFLSMLVSGLNMIGLTGIYETFFTGIFILIAVILNEQTNKLRDRILSET